MLLRDLGEGVPGKLDMLGLPHKNAYAVAAGQPPNHLTA
jgi:hypothetical protein